MYLAESEHAIMGTGLDKQESLSLIQSGRSAYYAKALSRPAIFQFDVIERRLLCQGFVVGKVDGLGASYYESHRSTEPGDDLIQPAGSNNPYGSESGLRDALWRTLTGNRGPEGAEWLQAVIDAC